MHERIDVSVIIVNYKVEKELLEAIESIKKSRPRVTYEVIVVDNDEEKTLEKNLKKKFPEVVYIPNPKNTGWGGGINVGAEVARGEYLYLLNPDTKLLSNALDITIDFYKTHQKAGVVASALYDRENKAYFPLGSQELNPWRAIVVYSLINKLSPKNPVSSSFFYEKTDRTKPFELEIAPLTASMIPADLFRKVGMFDLQFFLYFEEYDLGRRVNKKGYKNYLLPDAKVLHYWESSTKQRNDRNEILERSRYRYFKKHFGGVTARVVEAFLRRDLRILVVE